MKNKGLHAYRFGNNPEERRFAAEWERQNRECLTLEYLLGDDNSRAEPTDRERQVAATVVQWLGSPVGQCFLRDLGYTKNGVKL